MGFYKRFKKRYGNFEVIHVSADNSEEIMLEYMKDSDMDFPGLSREKRGKTSANSAAAGYIPCFSVVDSSGEIVVDGRKMGASAALAEFEKVLKRSKSAVPGG